MKCRACDHFTIESTVIANVEYFTCGSCGECTEIDLTPKSLEIEVLFRKGDERTHESYSSNFIIDGIDLLNTLVESEYTHNDFLGCFTRGWDKLNLHSKKQLLLLEKAEMDSGRCLIYICPECADVGCGAYGCHIKKDGDFYIWENFAYENGYEEPRIIEGVGPYRFKASEYKSAIEFANAL